MSAPADELCTCGAGVPIEQCSGDPQPLIYNYVLSYVFTAGLLLLFSAVSRRNPSRPSPISKDSDLFLSSWTNVSPYALLRFRLMMVAIYWIPTTDMIMKDTTFPIRFFTNWNWMMIGFYFTLASIVSINALYFTNKDLPRLKRLMLLAFEIELPASLFVSFLIWVVLLPIAFRTGGQAAILNWRSFVTHGLNSLMMLTELALNGMYLTKAGILKFLTWPIFYVIFHTSYVLYRDISPDYTACPVYSIMAPSSPYLMVWVVSIFVIALGIFTAIFSLSSKKQRFIENNLRQMASMTTDMLNLTS